MGITMTFFLCHNLAISTFNKLCFLIFSHSFSHTRVSPGTAASIITLDGKIPSKFEKFVSTTLSGSCSYQTCSSLLNPSFSQSCQCTCLPALSCLCLYSFWASLPHWLTIWDVVSFFVPHVLQRGDLAVLSISYLMQLVCIDCSWALYIKVLVHPFKLLYLIHLCLFSSLFSISQTDCRFNCFALHSFFLCSSLFFVNSLGWTVSSCVNSYTFSGCN